MDSTALVRQTKLEFDFMDTTKFTTQSVVKLDMLNEDQLEELAGWCKNRAAEVGWERIQRESAERDARWKREREEKEAKEKALVIKLKKVVKPGTRLKMKGCRDSEGIREFINWDHNNSLVCWQLYRGERTNQVTTHMPDKVQKVFVHGTAVAVRSLPA